jgi:SAM-dependent methyltransferase
MSNPFDVLAPAYDDEFTLSPIARYLRDKVQARLLAHFTSPQHVLELGCGTGEDALFLAEHGLHITATDFSDEMLAITRQKTAHTERVYTEKLNLDTPPKSLQHTPQKGLFDGAYSNFGVINCVHDRPQLAHWLAQFLKPNAIVGFAIMSPLCIWEIAWHIAHFKWAIATRRFATSHFQPTPTSESINVYYPSPHQLMREFAPFFDCVALQPLGVFLPPTALYPVAEKRPRLFKRLLSLESRFGNTRPLAILADHYWIEFRKKA